MNGVTSFLDASTIYGSSEERASQLRLFEGGLLRLDGDDLLPMDPACDALQNGTVCVESGDVRVNDSPAMTALHTLFARQHNRLAIRLAKVSPTWDDDILYSEARRLVTAQIQHVTYREFLPAVLGENLAENLQLTPLSAGRFLDYDIDVYPGALEAAASAAMSFSLAMLPADFQVPNEEHLSLLRARYDSFPFSLGCQEREQQLEASELEASRRGAPQLGEHDEPASQRQRGRRRPTSI